mmetsp:Transcript_39373/g.111572  ORF Transcript_39373/g.111572 Transcript_39373/m.111572 type:complete len:220 (+) Transcript_39373:2316-2975(+)
MGPASRGLRPVPAGAGGPRLRGGGAVRQQRGAAGGRRLHRRHRAAAGPPRAPGGCHGRAGSAEGRRGSSSSRGNPLPGRPGAALLGVPTGDGHHRRHAAAVGRAGRGPGAHSGGAGALKRQRPDRPRLPPPCPTAGDGHQDSQPQGVDRGRGAGGRHAGRQRRLPGRWQERRHHLPAVPPISSHPGRWRGQQRRGHLHRGAQRRRLCHRLLPVKRKPWS